MASKKDVTAAIIPPDYSKGGAPRGNANALRHGLYSARSGELASQYARTRANHFRVALEAACVAKHGEVSVFHASCVNTACEAQRVALANREFLAELLNGGKPVAPELRLKFDEAYLKSLDRRDAKVKMLGLDAATIRDKWAEAMYGPDALPFPAPDDRDGEGDRDGDDDGPAATGEDRDGDASTTPAGSPGDAAPATSTTGEPTTDHAGETPHHTAAGSLYDDNSANGCRHTTEAAEAENGDSRVPGGEGEGEGESGNEREDRGA